MDAEFREIFELSCEKGFRAIIHEAEWYLANEPQARTRFVEKLAALANYFERAAEDTFVRLNRLRLLNELRRAMHWAADFSKIAG